ncbi:hypothetical protein K456DRAFT_48798 [Colletotrichum gloeosporioides 23]|nr:hypothetical protein K456DRAFT_48798 [Colletotrichum gloeosporioides 23]
MHDCLPVTFNIPIKVPDRASNTPLRFLMLIICGFLYRHVALAVSHKYSRAEI